MDKSIKPKEFQRDLHIELRYPTISPSSMSQFKYDAEVWYDSYVLGNRKSPNSAMQGGIDVGERIVSDKTFLPSIPRGGVFEQKLGAVIKDIRIRGDIDQWFPNIPAIHEYKTSSNKSRWNQKRVDELEQITFYCVLVYLNYDIRPEDLELKLFAIPMIESGDFRVRQEGKVICYETKRNMLELLNFIIEIKKTHKAMEDFIALKKYENKEKK